VSQLKSHRRDLAYCARCPKMCRSSCPVSEATGNEAHTPHAKMGAAWHHLTELRHLDESAGASLYACLDCRRCLTQCRHQSDVGRSLFAARAEAMDEGEAPKAIDVLKRRFGFGQEGVVSGNA